MGPPAAPRFHRGKRPHARATGHLAQLFRARRDSCHPNLQGHGLGLCLIEELAWNAPASYLLLSTPEVPNEANAAFGLYRKVGFFDVLRNLEYPADERAFAILAARLPLSAT